MFSALFKMPVVDNFFSFRLINGLTIIISTKVDRRKSFKSSDHLYALDLLLLTVQRNLLIINDR